MRAAEVPIRIVATTARDLPSYSTLVQLQQTLLEEERVTFLRSLSGPLGTHPMCQLHSAAVYQKALCRIFEISGAPLAQVLRERNAAVMESVCSVMPPSLFMSQIARLEAEQRELLQELGKKGRV